ncbi:uncharacterized protein [Nerophis lumbriciformis]|uniref:uncharacterized protein n=1 Tax=Nerophis lumbriciformis TaxID=546530 RepID=UPI002AE00D62|nr:uncharacterized protein LOC133615236 [Nerophis lumbriciformis]
MTAFPSIRAPFKDIIREKMLMRQFVLMKQKNEVPRHISVHHMKQWRLIKTNFHKKFQMMGMRTIHLELGWIRAAFLSLNQLEKEVCEELNEEIWLSQLLGRRVTLDGLQMFLAVVCPKTEQEVERFLRYLLDELQKMLSSSNISWIQEVTLLTELRRRSVHLVREVVDHAVRVFLTPAVRDSSAESLRRRAETASLGVGRMLEDALTSCSCLSQHIDEDRLLYICSSVAWRTVESLFRSFVRHSESFPLLDFDRSAFTSRECILRAVEDMDYIATFMNV